MKNADKAFDQGYNSQAVVDSKCQIIVAADVNNDHWPKEFSADAGYFSEANLNVLRVKLMPPTGLAT